MYTRKTANAVELSEARRRASLARKCRRGGRPKGWRKTPGALPATTVAVDPLDLAVFRNYATLRGTTTKDALHVLAAALVFGAKVQARKELAPSGWALNRTATPKAGGAGA